MQTRNMERKNSIRERGKRGLEGEDEQQQPERKHPALASVIVEALKVDSLQKLCSSLEPILHRVWKEMHTKNMERKNSIRERGKRGLEGEDEQQQPERKRPALAR
ncbi:hypothetical protein L1987_80672 [Smallanthus sonchifolius]|uniref:Uncharacterized protein n=1 Tax=Smallanthus sonchifolius TaxID=185202 RepID=A0ACB8YNX8_9ASTR|nr:hypothetical protein L1987_80672 [Smallanthus sonchifolius]